MQNIVIPTAKNDTAEIALHTNWNDKSLKRLIIPSADETTEQMKLSYITGDNAKWFSHLGKRFSSLLKKIKHKHKLTI